MNNQKVGLGLIALLMCVSLFFMGAAQNTEDTSQLTRYVTGCLQKGHDADEYHLIAENANWHLKSDNVRLADHVGHKVRVAGAVSNQPFHGMKEDLEAEVKKNHRDWRPDCHESRNGQRQLQLGAQTKENKQVQVLFINAANPRCDIRTIASSPRC